jgi:nucleoside 2-deoxyribosyltransferase
MQARKINIFISHTYEDESFARRIADALKTSERINVVHPGEKPVTSRNVADKLSKTLERSDVVVSLLSPRSVDSPNLYAEIGMALGLGKKVLPVVKTTMDLSAIPFDLKDRQTIVSRGPKDIAEQIKLDLLSK